MNFIRSSSVHRSCRLAQTVYVVMLIIATVALALAIFFPTFEYIASYRKDPGYYKFDPGARPPTPAAAPRAPAPAPAPATAPEPEPEPPPADADATAAPEPVDGALLPAAQPYARGGIPAEGRVAMRLVWRSPVTAS